MKVDQVVGAVSSPRVLLGAGGPSLGGGDVYRGVSDLLEEALVAAQMNVCGRLEPRSGHAIGNVMRIPTPFTVDRRGTFPDWFLREFDSLATPSVLSSLEPWWRLIYRSSDRTFAGQTCDIAFLESVGMRLAGWAERTLHSTKPDVILWPNMPHGMPELIFMLVAESRGIRNYAFEATMSDSHLWLIDPVTRLRNPHDPLVAVLNPARHVSDIELNDLLNWDGQIPAREEQRRRMSSRRRIAPRIVASLLYHRALGRIQRLARHPTEHDVFSFMHFASAQQRAGVIGRGRQHRSYERICGPVPQDPFILLALHDEPERTVVPDCYPNLSHHLTIRWVIDAAAKCGMHVVVKEHPSHFALDRSSGWRRPMNWYENLRATAPGLVHFSSTRTHTADLLAMSSCVVTGRGTIGWEAVRRNKKVAVFGTPFYAGLPNVHYLTGTDALIEFLMSPSNPDLDRELLRSRLALSHTGINEDVPELLSSLAAADARQLAESSILLFVDSLGSRGPVVKPECDSGLN